MNNKSKLVSFGAALGLIAALAMQTAAVAAEELQNPEVGVDRPSDKLDNKLLGVVPGMGYVSGMGVPANIPSRPAEPAILGMHQCYMDHQGHYTCDQHATMGVSPYTVLAGTPLVAARPTVLGVVPGVGYVSGMGVPAYAAQLPARPTGLGVVPGAGYVSGMGVPANAAQLPARPTGLGVVPGAGYVSGMGVPAYVAQLPARPTGLGVVPGEGYVSGMGVPAYAAQLPARPTGLGVVPGEGYVSGMGVPSLPTAVPYYGQQAGAVPWMIVVPAPYGLPVPGYAGQVMPAPYAAPFAPPGGSAPAGAPQPVVCMMTPTEAVADESDTGAKAASVAVIAQTVAACEAIGGSATTLAAASHAAAPAQEPSGN